MRIIPAQNYESFFTHLSDNEMREIRTRIANKQSLAFTFLENDKEKFCVILDLDSESVHVRRIGGPFAWRWKQIEILCTIVAKRLHLNKITVVAQAAFMIFAVKKLGFNRVENDLYEKVIA